MSITRKENHDNKNSKLNLFARDNTLNLKAQSPKEALLSLRKCREWLLNPFPESFFGINNIVISTPDSRSQETYFYHVHNLIRGDAFELFMSDLPDDEFIKHPLIKSTLDQISSSGITKRYNYYNGLSAAELWRANYHKFKAQLNLDSSKIETGHSVHQEESKPTVNKPRS